MDGTFVPAKLACTFSFSPGILYYRNMGVIQHNKHGLDVKNIDKNQC